MSVFNHIDGYPAWSFDSSLITYHRQTEDRFFDVWVMNADGSGKRACTSSPAFEGRPSFTPDGMWILYQSDARGNYDIYRVPFTPAEGCGGPARALTGSPARDVEPVMAPDSSAIAFDTDREGTLEVYLMDPDGKRPRNCSQHPKSDHGPAWAPSSGRIAFHSHRGVVPRRKNGEIWEMTVQNGTCRDPVRLTFNDKLDEAPSYSPDGTKMVFHRQTEARGFEVYLLDLLTKEERNLTRHPADDITPAWSPDGSRIAFASGRKGGFDIWVMDPDGANLVRLTSD